MNTNIQYGKLAETEELENSIKFSESFYVAVFRNGFRLCSDRGLVLLDASIFLNVFDRKWIHDKIKSRSPHFSHFSNVVGLVRPSHWPVVRRLFAGKWIATFGFYSDEILVGVHGEKNCSDLQLGKFLDEFEKIVRIVAAGRKIRYLLFRSPAQKASWLVVGQKN